MALGYDGNLYILAFDHRGSFQKKMLGITGQPSEADAQRISDAKAVIYEGFLKALEEGAPKGEAGMLVDEQFGGDLARDGVNKGVVLAMPVERSGQDEFDFEYGEDFGKHIEAFNPTFSKVLVRYNPDGDAEMNKAQSERLKRLSDWLHDNGRRFLFELLVPATDEQTASVGGDADRYDREVRPNLMMRAIEELQNAGIEPDVWKIEGLDSREDCQKISELTRRDGRDGVACVVLGRGADDNAVDTWLKAGAGVPGYRGFAIGRTIWWDALKSYLDNEIERDEAASRISQNYRRFIEVYRSA